VEAQLKVAPAAELFVARHSNHGTLIRDPESAMVAAITRFVERCATARSACRPASVMRWSRRVVALVVVDRVVLRAAVVHIASEPGASESGR
jgi:hypothetical protein